MLTTRSPRRGQDRSHNAHPPRCPRGCGRSDRRNDCERHKPQREHFHRRRRVQISEIEPAAPRVSSSIVCHNRCWSWQQPFDGRSNRPKELNSHNPNQKVLEKGRKKLIMPSKRGQMLFRRSAVSRCISPWLSSLRGEVTCLLAFNFTLDRKHVVMRARGQALLVLSQVHSWLLPS